MGSEKICEGDVVRLKSGGPKMTVESLRDSEECNVSWFDPHGEMKRATVRVAALKRKGHS
jgi:uncharacterized protein YodC (DUF2158 family)